MHFEAQYNVSVKVFTWKIKCFARHVVSFADRRVPKDSCGNEQSARDIKQSRLGNLRDQLANLLDSDLSSCSKQLYQRARMLYAEFSGLHLSHAVLFPISVENLALFITYLNGKGYAPASISSYVSALGYQHKIKNMPDPTVSFIVKRLLRSVHKVGRKGDTRLPITEPILNQLLHSLPHISSSNYDKTMFASMFTLSFYAFLRIGEITVNGKSDENNLQLSSIIFGEQGVPSRLELTMHHFKWHKSSRPVVLSIARNNKDPSLCPLSALASYLTLRRESPGPLFCHPPDKPVNRAYFNTALKRAVEFIGYDSKLYKSHSFRVGAATRAVDLGFSEVEIQHMGRWGSNSAYKNYVRISLTKGCTE